MYVMTDHKVSNVKVISYKKNKHYNNMILFWYSVVKLTTNILEPGQTALYVHVEAGLALY
jgi:hypothetical protein